MEKSRQQSIPQRSYISGVKALEFAALFTAMSVMDWKLFFFRELRLTNLKGHFLANNPCDSR